MPRVPKYGFAWKANSYLKNPKYEKINKKESKI